MLRNPRRSGGPKTDKGKSAISLNAVKTGAYSVSQILPGEDLDQFLEIESQFVSDFGPVGTAEASMVHDLAVLTWKKLRIERVEHAMLSQSMRQPLTDLAISKGFGAGFMSNALPYLQPFKPISKAERDKMVDLRFDIDFAVDDIYDSDGDKLNLKLEKSRPKLYAFLLQLRKEFKDSFDAWLTRVSDDDLISELIKAKDHCDLMIWLYDNAGKLDLVLRQAREARLVDFMRNNVIQRAQDDVSKAFYRTLSELRRQQEWRIRREAVLIQEVAVKDSSKQTKLVRKS